MTTIQVKPQDPYWVEFATYQSFDTVDEMVAQVKLFEKTHILTPAIKAVLNTLKLHAKRYFAGVCWLKREEIAKKAKVSLASVKRAIKALKEIGILTVHPHIHTKRGGQAHNVYVINPLFKPENEPPSVASEEPETPTAPTVCEPEQESYTNPDTNSHTKDQNISIEKFDYSVASDKPTPESVLKDVPNEFIDLLEPFYANSPKTIHARWKTVLSAAKRSCNGVRNASVASIRDAWKETVKQYKRGKLKNATDDGIGAYFYGVLCDYLLDDWLRNAIKA